MLPPHSTRRRETGGASVSVVALSCLVAATLLIASVEAGFHNVNHGDKGEHLEVSAAPKQGGPLNILIVGGTQMLGTALVEGAKQAGHTVTIISRRPTGGQDPAVSEEAFAALLAGDKSSAYDVVVDNSAFTPQAVETAVGVFNRMAKEVRPRQYILISTMSVYENLSHNVKETAPLLPREDTPIEGGRRSMNYGELKVGCEQEAQKFDGVVTILRPQVICGPLDNTFRFNYWVKAFRDSAKNGQPVRAPAYGESQVAYSMDIATWIADRLVYETTSEIYNTGGEPMPTQDFIKGIAMAFQGQTADDIVWTTPDDQQRIPFPYIDYTIDVTKAHQAGYKDSSLAAMATSVLEDL